MYTFSLAQTKPAATGVLFRLEKLMAHINPEAVPILIGSWGVGAVKQNYGLAKIELYYHPREARALEKKQLLCELSDYCRHEGIDLLAKLVVYTPSEEKFTVAAFQQAQLQTVQELSRYCSVVALQYPQDALACATLTAELDIPWLVSSDDLGYEAFKDILRTAINNGARGYLADAVFWQEMYDLKLDDGTPNWTKVTEFLQTTARDRSIELRRVAIETDASHS
jgi:tagatose-1,6-bisphosphate aldolase